MRKKGFVSPKWKLTNKYWWPHVWVNLKPEVFEEKWIVDLGFGSRDKRINYD